MDDRAGSGRLGADRGADQPEVAGASHEQDRGSVSSGTPPRRSRRRRWPWVVGAIAVVLVLALVAGVLYLSSVARSFDDNRTTVDAQTQQREAGDPVNILLLGSDSRADDDREEGSERKDTMMLVHIPADGSGVYVISLLRDLYVDIPGHGRDKLNAASAEGGYPLLIDTVEQMFDIPVHHLVEMDFQGFRSVTSALGGVSVCNPTAFSSGQKNPSYFPRGQILLKDTAALRYVRERHAFGDGDLSRVENQQRVVESALGRFLSVDVLANPGRTNDVVSTFSRHLTVDEGLDSQIVGQVGWRLRDLDKGDLEMLTVPSGDAFKDARGQSVVGQDEQLMRQLRAALADDDLGRYVEAREKEEAQAKKERQQRRAAQAESEPTSQAEASGAAKPEPAVDEPCG